MEVSAFLKLSSESEPVWIKIRLQIYWALVKLFYGWPKSFWSKFTFVKKKKKKKYVVSSWPRRKEDKTSTFTFVTKKKYVGSSWRRRNKRQDVDVHFLNVKENNLGRRLKKDIDVKTKLRTHFLFTFQMLTSTSYQRDQLAPGNWQFGIHVLRAVLKYVQFWNMFQIDIVNVQFWNIFQIDTVQTLSYQGKTKMSF